MATKNSSGYEKHNKAIVEKRREEVSEGGEGGTEKSEEEEVMVINGNGEDTQRFCSSPCNDKQGID